MDVGDWICSECGFINLKEFRSCAGCGLSLPSMLDMTGSELADAFRSELRTLRRQLAELRNYASGVGIDLLEKAIDRLAARGANMCDVATGAVVVKPAAEAKT
jgi:hypothetical protein